MVTGSQRAGPQGRGSSLLSKPLIPGVIRRNTLYLSGATAFFSIAFITFISLSPPLMVSLTGSLAFAGVPQSLNAFMRMVVSYPIGRSMDRYGRRPPLAGAMLLGGGAAFLVVYAVSAPSLWACLRPGGGRGV